MKSEDQVSAKEQLVLPFPPIDRGEAGQRNEDSRSENAPRGKGNDAPARPLPPNRRELALAIFAQCDPVALGCAILQNGEDRGASVRLRGLEMFTEWVYGKEDEEEDPEPTRLIWDLPRRGERGEGSISADSERAEGGER